MSPHANTRDIAVVRRAIGPVVIQTPLHMPAFDTAMRSSAIGHRTADDGAGTKCGKRIPPPIMAPPVTVPMMARSAVAMVIAASIVIMIMVPAVLHLVDKTGGLNLKPSHWC